MLVPELKGLHEILGNLLERGQIYECDIAFASPAFVIKKKLRGYRLLANMWQMNAAIEDYSWLLPNISALLDCCNGCKFFWFSTWSVDTSRCMYIQSQSC
ncbi:hypothetical protein BX661DRAFT_219367 [Kickxella alabastrina]|uniref:uncharacterized protein n=1 Tax=Kickxella alabastrina TaxID=61397 RepID=UPI00222128C0|nr:uncharacterized protein BX661DRAFT_219367 [Kickxella alabastrina]KAI7819465.1 hypothetical protein BX661DRAFT_219367 [Kickxella alabastrina]